MSRKKWIIPKNDRQKAIAMSEKYDMDLLTSSLLLSRGIESEDEVLSFCSQETVLCDPFDLKDMDKAVAAIGEALDAGEKITVYGDYDADGVTSTAVMFTFLEMQGADVDFYIPDRNTEGYGMNKK
ncbi:MAG: DHH family phosphoesterase, partial [Acutalibacteraceae bacterium]